MKAVLLALMFIAVPLVFAEVAQARPEPPQCISVMPCCETLLCWHPEPCRPVGDKYIC